MTLTNEEYMNRLTNNLTSKKLILRDIVQITKEQDNSIIDEDYVKLSHYIDAKQEKIDAINILDSEFEVYFKRFKSVLGINTFEDAAFFKIPGLRELKGHVTEINSLLYEIQQLETENNKKIKMNFDEVKGHIKNINASVNATKAYLGDSKLETYSYFIDSKK